MRRIKTYFIRFIYKRVNSSLSHGHKKFRKISPKVNENLKAEFDEVSTFSVSKDNDTDSNLQENKSFDAISRNSSSENISVMGNQAKSSKINKSKNTSGNQLTQMRTRASKNKTFIYIKVPGVQHCLSYKGSKTKNIVDLYDFTFKLPTMEFRNKTWTWLDLLMNVKKMVISTVLSHTGSLVKTKISQLRKGGIPYADTSKNEFLTVPNTNADSLKSAKSESDIYVLGLTSNLSINSLSSTCSNWSVLIF